MQVSSSQSASYCTIILQAMAARLTPFIFIKHSQFFPVPVYLLLIKLIEGSAVGGGLMSRVKANTAGLFLLYSTSPEQLHKERKVPLLTSNAVDCAAAGASL